MQFLSYLVRGISLGSVYALIALGYTMAISSWSVDMLCSSRFARAV